MLNGSQILCMNQSTPEENQELAAAPGGYPDLLAGEHLPPLPKQERSRKKREALLQAALTLFAKQGYEATSVEEIASHAHVAVGGFYQHFASKRQLLLVLMDRLLQEAAQIGPPLDANLADIRSLIAQLVLQGLQVDWSYAGAYRAWREAAIQDPDLRALNVQVEGWFAMELHLLFSFLLQLPGARREVDSQTLAWEISLLFLRLVEVPLEQPEAVSALVESLTHLIYHGLFADEPPQKR